MSEILLIGEINLDIFIILKENKTHTKNYLVKIGGTTLNIAKSLKYLGINPVIFSHIGKDLIGKGIYDELSKDFNLSLIQRNDLTNIILYFIKNDKFEVIGLKKESPLFRIDENFLKIYKDVRLVHISPYIFLRKENYDFFEKIKDENKIFIINLSMPILDNQKFTKILNGIDYIFMNLEEGKKLVKKDDLFKIKIFLKENFKNSVLTLPNGIYFLNKEKEIFIEVEKIHKKINIGSGDYLLGGFIYGLSKNLKIEDSLNIGLESVKNYLNSFKI
ncbi:MAG: carbohydrate kinase family protein [Caldisericia bacterium]